VKGPFLTKGRSVLAYKGNNIYSPINDVSCVRPEADAFHNRVAEFHEGNGWKSISRINHSINWSVNKFFHEMGACFTILPLTTRMISSPGAVYGREAINYTSDTCPITLNWFDLPKTAFLAESSQIYLELSLLQPGVDHVYCVYNSFRKEEADTTHLSEFHHVEYEGKVDQNENEKIALEMVSCVISDLLKNEEEELAHFIKPADMKELEELASDIHAIPRLTFREALDILRDDTGDDKYRNFTLNGNFGFWEEVRLTEILGTMCVVKQFPLLEVPFYHTLVENSEPPVADNADFIWPGYREFIGSGARIETLSRLHEKAKIFNLPLDDYKPYLQSRERSCYVRTSGFGLGWERMLQGLLQMPYIWSAVHFPRVHTTLVP
jgi:asparaginyl-tRNA synthetase